MPAATGGGLGRLRESVRMKMPGLYSLGLLAGTPDGHLTTSEGKDRALTTNSFTVAAQRAISV
jgi:hypothetical protein